MPLYKITKTTNETICIFADDEDTALDEALWSPEEDVSIVEVKSTRDLVSEFDLTYAQNMTGTTYKYVARLNTTDCCTDVKGECK